MSSSVRARSSRTDSPVWIFPGQGAQRDEMWRQFADGDALMQEAGAVVGEALVDRCRAVPADAWPGSLMQPAMLATCVAAARELAPSSPAPAAVLGHSLGEYAALVAAGSLEFSDAVRVVRARGEGMDAASRVAPGAMAAVLDLAPGLVEQVCTETQGVWPANYNAPGQTVLSGRVESVELAAERCEQLGASAVIPLRVPAATHTPLMEPALRMVKAELERCRLRVPRCRFYSGVDGAPHSDPGRIRALLERAVVAPVRFEDAVRAAISDSCASFVEVGPGKVLTRLVKQVSGGVEVSSSRAWLRDRRGTAPPAGPRAARTAA